MLKLTDIKVSDPLKLQLSEAEKIASKHDLSEKMYFVYCYGILTMALNNATGKDRNILGNRLKTIEKEIAKDPHYCLSAITAVTEQASSNLKIGLRAFATWINKTKNLELIPSA